MAGFLVAGVASGVGKTTITVGLIAALRRRGLRVQPFKVGPDYIDPTYHTRAAGGVPGRNLDRWLLSAASTRTLYARAASGADVSVVEGVMGLFDGRLEGEGFASSAHLARELGLPVILVVDAGKLSWSAGALVLGYRDFDPSVDLAGVILNRVGGPRHATELVAAIEGRTGVPVLGCLEKDGGLVAPERYLGLVPVPEGPDLDAYFQRAESAVTRGVDLDRVSRIADRHRLPAAPEDAEADVGPLFPTEPVVPRAVIAYARDAAFSFYYQDSLDLLHAWGAHLVPFSPLADSGLPPDTAGVYLGGGFPELFARELAENAPLLDALRAAGRQGLPIYAECGGLMLLGQSLVDQAGRRFDLAGLLPARSTLAHQRLTMGYREAQPVADSFLLERGEAVRAHEFHWSTLEAEPGPGDAAYIVAGRESPLEGFRSQNVLASYLHLHFGAFEDGRLARRFVAGAARARGARGN